MVEREESSLNVGMGLIWMAAGVIVGAGLALLYAPRTGRELRERMSGFTNDTMAKMKDFSSTAQEKMKTTFQRGKEMAEEKAAGYTGSSERDVTFH